MHEISQLRHDIQDAGLYRVNGRLLLRSVASDTALYVACVWLAMYAPRIGGFAFAFPLVRLQYHQHDVYHRQYDAILARAGFESRWVADVLSMWTGVSSYYWIDHNHKPHHAHVNDFRFDSNQFVFPWWKIGLLPCALPIMIVKSVYYGVAAQSAVATLFPTVFTVLCIGRFGWVGWWCVCLGYVFSMISTQVIHHKLPCSPHPNYFVNQIRQSQNVTGSVVLEWLMGGHQHQIEHHLFPRMPRHNLPRASRFVAAFCERIGEPYQVRTWQDAYIEYARRYRTQT
jgi:fatty acid desaturase